MADGRIITVGEHDCHLHIQAEHWHPEADRATKGQVWFIEDYLWQGREGLARKRLMNARGELLLTDDTVAPQRPARFDGDVEEYYLPEGKDWKRATQPSMDDDSVFDIIKAIHRKRLITGWDNKWYMPPSHMHPKDRDRDGCSHLTSHYRHLVGQEFTV
jgi:hypothetical protein